MPFDAHQAKSLLTKNDFLAKLACLFGIQEFILYEKKGAETQEVMVDEGCEVPEWVKKKQAIALMKEYDLDRYINYSFRKDFKLNNRDIELYEPSKILGDVFEALIGAVFIDGGIEEVINIYQHLLAPFILYVAKFSKRLNKEPKEDFTILAGLHKIVPQILNKGECELAHAEITKFLKLSNSESLE